MFAVVLENGWLSPGNEVTGVLPGVVTVFFRHKSHLKKGFAFRNLSSPLVRLLPSLRFSPLGLLSDAAASDFCAAAFFA